MLLTEPEAGSDVGALTTTAVKNDDGTYSITGNKIFISGGEHDLAENIIHPVLARIEGAPEGTKGISLFLVPKYRVNDDGSLGEFNDVVCTGIEEKMGIHGNATCSLTLGGKGSAGDPAGRGEQGHAGHVPDDERGPPAGGAAGLRLCQRFLHECRELCPGTGPGQKSAQLSWTRMPRRFPSSSIRMCAGS